MGEQAKTSNSAGVVIVDLKKQTKGKIKKLRQGQGKLMKSVQDTIDKLQASGETGGANRPVIVIVEAKKKTPSFL